MVRQLSESNKIEFINTFLTHNILYYPNKSIICLRQGGYILNNN